MEYQGWLGSPARRPRNDECAREGRKGLTPQTQECAFKCQGEGAPLEYRAGGAALVEPAHPRGGHGTMGAPKRPGSQSKIFTGSEVE
jgi:hypothetical protein